MHVEHLFVYPVKSLGGVELPESELDERGLRYDRRYMLVDEHGSFMSQRKFPHMSLFRTALLEYGIQISFTGDSSFSSIEIPYNKEGDDWMNVQVWEDRCKALVVSKEVNQFFSETLGKKCALVYMPDSTRREVDKNFAHHNEVTSFADAFPVLLIGTASLDELNSRLPADNQMNWDRFRPNIVVKTSVPFEEDNWDYFFINENELQCVKPCARCVMTTVNQQTAVVGKEPLRSLSIFRTTQNKVMFGQNVLLTTINGKLKKGDRVQLKN